MSERVIKLCSKNDKPGLDPDLSVRWGGGGLKLGKGSRGPLRPLCGWGGSQGQSPTDGKRFSVFELLLEGTPL